MTDYPPEGKVNIAETRSPNYSLYDDQPVGGAPLEADTRG